MGHPSITRRPACQKRHSVRAVTLVLPHKSHITSLFSSLCRLATALQFVWAQAIERSSEDAMKAFKFSKLAVVVSAVMVLGGQAMGQQATQQVESTENAKTTERVIVVSLEDRKLALVEDGQVKKVYSVAVGKPTTPSPVGTFTIARRVKNPTYSARWQDDSAGAGQSGGDALDGAQHQGLRNPRDKRTEVDRQGCFARVHSHGEEGPGRVLRDGGGGRHGGTGRPAQ